LRKQMTTIEVELLRKRAQSGDTEAMCELAIMYAEGTGGLGQDYKKARYLLERAAKLGHVVAKCELGKMCFEDGDKEKGILLLLDAALLGDEQAEEFLLSWFNISDIRKAPEALLAYFRKRKKNHAITMIVGGIIGMVVPLCMGGGIGWGLAGMFFGTGLGPFGAAVKAESKTHNKNAFGTLQGSGCLLALIVVLFALLVSIVKVGVTFFVCPVIAIARFFVIDGCMKQVALKKNIRR